MLTKKKKRYKLCGSIKYYQSTNQAIGLQTTMLFGKYLGLTVNEILLKDYEYMKWLVLNDRTHIYGKGLKTKLNII